MIKTSKKAQLIMAVIMIVAMVIGLGGSMVTVQADTTTTYHTVGYDGKITIKKYVGTSEQIGWDTSGNPQTAPGSDAKPLKDVQFTIKKVGSINQTADTDGNVKLTYTVDSALADKLGVSTICTSTELDKKLRGLTDAQGTAKELVSGGTIITTNDSGEASLSVLEYGLYLVVETDAPSDVTAKSVPFFVSIPSVVNDSNGNISWTTEVTAYPKNVVGTATIDKKIIEGTTETTHKTDNVNGLIDYKVSFTVPIPADGLAQLRIKDEMTGGLVYAADTGNPITVKRVTDSGEETIAATNYTVTVADDKKSFTVDFTADYLETLSDEEKAVFYITYPCELTEDAILGSTGNVNKADLYYTNNPDISIETLTPAAGVDEDTGAPVVYTYGIKITKKDSNGTTLLEGVEFTLTNDSGTEINSTTYASNNNKNATDANGVLEFRGLAAGTYTLTEIKTNTGYILLKDPIEIVITPGSTDPSKATATVSNTGVAMVKDHSSADAIVPITILNEKGFSLPTTGGDGTALFAFGGILLVVVAGLLLVMRKKSGSKVK